MPRQIENLCNSFGSFIKCFPLGLPKSQSVLSTEREHNTEGEMGDLIGLSDMQIPSVLVD